MICKCLRPSCKHEWKARTEESPANCPKCRSYAWDKPIDSKTTKPTKELHNEPERL
jgi:hypothetical protein